MYCLPSCAECVPPTWLARGLACGLDQGLSLLLPSGTSFGRSVQPRPPYFRRGRRTDLSPREGGSSHPGSAWARLSPPTPLNGYTFTLFRRHPRRHGRSSIRLQTIHMHYWKRLVPFPAHDDSSSIQHFCDECRAEPRELQLRSPRSFQRYVVNPCQLSRLVLSPLNITVVVMFLVQRCPLQPRTSVPVRRPQSSLECSHIRAHRACLLLWSQGCSIHSLDRKSCLSCQDKWHELVPLLLRLSARRLQTPAQRPKAPFYEPVAPGVVRCSPSLVYSKQAAHLQHYLGPEIRALVTMQLSESYDRATISNTNFLSTVVAFWSGMGKHSSHFEK